MTRPRLGDIADHDCGARLFRHLKPGVVAGAWACPECRARWTFRMVTNDNVPYLHAHRYRRSSFRWRRARRKEMQR